MIIKKNASKSTSAIASCERGLLRHKKPCSRTLLRKSENPKFRSKNPDLTVSLRENTIWFNVSCKLCLPCRARLAQTLQATLPKVWRIRSRLYEKTFWHDLSLCAVQLLTSDEFRSLFVIKRRYKKPATSCAASSAGSSAASLAFWCLRSMRFKIPFNFFRTSKDISMGKKNLNGFQQKLTDHYRRPTALLFPIFLFSMGRKFPQSDDSCR